MLNARARRAAAGALFAAGAVVAWAAWVPSRHHGASAGPPVFPFVNASNPAGIRVSYGHPPGLLSILETAGSGAGFLDYDRDGNLDIVLVGTDRCMLFRNNGNGTFSETTRDAGLEQKGHWLGCACADYDNDGYPETFL